MSTPTPARPGVVTRLRAHPRLLLLGGLGFVAAAAFVLWWFQPQALLFDQVVDEDFPVAGGEPGPETATTGTGADTTTPEPAGTIEPTGTATPEAEVVEARGTPQETDAPGRAIDGEVEEPTGPRALSTGTFASRNRYTVTGGATVYELDDGSVTLRLEPFESSNGPDLYVYLTAADHADDDDALDADHVDLGVLRGNIGNQNYEVPDGVDLDTYDTVVIWCRRFSVSFGAADLAPPTG